jgi:hypothetical protein
VSYKLTGIQHALYLRELKSDLQMGVVIVLYDFAENCVFILQVYEYKRNNYQASLHLFEI